MSGFGASVRYALEHEGADRFARFRGEAALERFLRVPADDDGGYVPVREAAKVMGCDVSEVMELAEAGALRTRVSGGMVEMVPAILSRVRVAS